MDLLPNETISGILDEYTGSQLILFRVSRTMEAHVQSRVKIVRDIYEAKEAIQRDDALSLMYSRGVDWNEVFELSYVLKYTTVNKLAQSKIKDWRPSVAFLDKHRLYNKCVLAMKAALRDKMFNEDTALWIGKNSPSRAHALLSTQIPFSVRQDLLRGICESGKWKYIVKNIHEIGHIGSCVKHILLSRTKRTMEKYRQLCVMSAHSAVRGAVCINDATLVNQFINDYPYPESLSGTALIVAISLNNIVLAESILDRYPIAALSLNAEHCLTSSTPLEFVKKILGIAQRLNITNTSKDLYMSAVLVDNKPVVEYLKSTGVSKRAYDILWALKHNRTSLKNIELKANKFYLIPTGLTQQIHGVRIEPEYQKYVDYLTTEHHTYNVTQRDEVADFLHSLGLEYILGAFTSIARTYDILVRSLRLFIRCDSEFFTARDHQDTYMQIDSKGNYKKYILGYIDAFNQQAS